MFTTGTINPYGLKTFRSFRIRGASILARVSFDDGGPGLFIEGYDANGRYRAAPPNRLMMETSEAGFSYLSQVLAALTAEVAYAIFMTGKDADFLLDYDLTPSAPALRTNAPSIRAACTADGLVRVTITITAEATADGQAIEDALPDAAHELENEVGFALSGLSADGIEIEPYEANE